MSNRAPSPSRFASLGPWLAVLGLVAVACSDTPEGARDASGEDASSVDASAADAASDAASPDAGLACPPANVIDNRAAAELAVVEDSGSAMGIFDPSFVYPTGATAGAMAYSSVPTQETIRTRVAVSSDGGATWTYVAELNQPEAATLPSSDATECPGGSCAGRLISEVSSLVYDADDPDPARRWKLFAHRYLVGPGVALHYRIGTIALQTAARVEGPWTPPQKLIGWTSPAPYSSTGVTTNASTLPGLADCLALTEPGALWLPGSLHLAVGCIYLEGATPRIRIELLRSTDHAATWTAAGTLLRPADAACLRPGASINAAELIAADGALYVAATPSDAAGYHGCLVFPIADLAAARVVRGADGVATPRRVIATAPTRFAGACAYAAGAGGYAMSIGFLGDNRPFRLFRTGLSAP
ncbi:MAG: hypothetical protein KBG48_30395 [Kofleriaceae bacterium]|nr:hypothetical protein [Kofleriaceae bacterium]MBP9171741.1 hypothetical protein [Kofleriaceae bacterium]MBP9856338.1 hypothetical protein [Kofleriaceae bacterium]